MLISSVGVFMMYFLLHQGIVPGDTFMEVNDIPVYMLNAVDFKQEMIKRPLSLRLFAPAKHALVTSGTRWTRVGGGGNMG